MKNAPAPRKYVADQFRYKIDAAIPCPDKPARGGQTKRQPNSLYPFPLMAVGDSFLVPVEDASDVGAPFTRLATACSAYHQTHPQRFTWRTRTLAEHGEAGWRVWRLL